MIWRENDQKCKTTREINGKKQVGLSQNEAIFRLRNTSRVIPDISYINFTKTIFTLYQRTKHEYY